MEEYNPWPENTPPHREHNGFAGFGQRIIRLRFVFETVGEALFPYSQVIPGGLQFFAFQYAVARSEVRFFGHKLERLEFFQAESPVEQAAEQRRKNDAEQQDQQHFRPVAIKRREPVADHPHACARYRQNHQFRTDDEPFCADGIEQEGILVDVERHEQEQGDDGEDGVELGSGHRFCYHLFVVGYRGGFC